VRPLPGAARLPPLALATGPVQGIWGGLSEDERRLLRQREAKARVRAARQPGPSRPAPSLAAGAH
jgi:hypothetical protein